MKSGWVDREAALSSRTAQNPASTAIWRCASIRRGCSAAIPSSCCTAAATRRSRRACAICFGEEVEVLRVKGSGGDMAAIEPAGLAGGAACAAAQAARARRDRATRKWLRIERANLIDPAAPNPSVEMMLHAFLPHKFVDHTHATAVLSLIDQPDGESKCAEVFDGRLASCPTSCRASASPRRRSRSSNARKPSDGLILSKHGIVTFGESAREAYERMIEMVSLAEDFIARHRKPSRGFVPTWPQTCRRSRRSRRSCAARAAEKDEKIEGAWRRLVLDFRGGDAVLSFLQSNDLAAAEPKAAWSRPTTPSAPRTGRWSCRAPRRRQARRLRARRRARRRELCRALPRLFRTPQQARRRRQAASSIRCPASCWCRASACSASAAPSATPRSPPTSPKPGSKAWPTPKRSAASSRSPKPTCSTANTGRSNRPSSAPRKEPPLAGQIAAVTGAAGAIGAATAQGVRCGGRRGRAARCRSRGGARQAPRRSAPTALAVALRRDRCGLGARGLRPDRRRISAASTSWCRMPAPPGRAASAKSTKRFCARASS